MRKFIQRALEKFDKMDKEQVKSLLCRIANENELLDMVLDSMTDGVVVTDKKHRILLYNKSFGRLIPFKHTEDHERKLWDSIEDREIALFFNEKLNNQEKVIDKEFTLANGVTKTIAVSIMPLVKDGKVQGTLVHVEDITEKRSKEARLRRAENLAALTTLAAGIAHEIKNPLGSIGIHIQLIQKAIRNKETIERKDIESYLSVINEEVDRLNRIIVDFLFAVRPMDTKLEDSDINQVIKGLLEFVKYELEESNIRVETHLEEDLPKIKLDAKYFKQALLNLIKNSLYAMPDGGILKIETGQSGDTVFVKVIDNGVGIPKDIIDKIFEPYFTTKDFGTGLGLTLVYKIVKEHMGEIAVESKEGKGTTFILSFPVPQKEKRLIGYVGDAKNEV